MIVELKNFVKNLDFEKYKDKLKPLGIAAICFIAVFASGFGIGKSYGNGGESSSPTMRSDNTNYTTNSNAQAKTDSTKKEPEKTSNKNTNSNPKPEATSTNPATNTGECNIKGSKSKIYHVPGGSFYNRTNPAQCFATEEEAQSAGYTKSSR